MDRRKLVAIAIWSTIKLAGMIMCYQCSAWIDEWMNRILTTFYSKGHNCIDYHSLDRVFFGMLVNVIFSVSSVMEFFLFWAKIKRKLLHFLHTVFFLDKHLVKFSCHWKVPKFDFLSTISMAKCDNLNPCGQPQRHFNIMKTYCNLDLYYRNLPWMTL